MVAITQPLQVRQAGGNPEVNIAQPFHSERATAEMMEIAEFQQLAMATHMTRHQARGGHLTLAQRALAGRERKLLNTNRAEAERNENGEAPVHESDRSDRNLPKRRGEFEDAEMARLRQQLERSGRGPSSEEDLNELKKKHAESINGGLDVEVLLGDSSGDSRRQLSDDTVKITGFKFDSKDKAIEPLALLDSLEHEFGKDRVDGALLDVKKAVGAEARLRSAEGPGPRSWRSFALGKAYHALISSRAIGSDMRSKISGLGAQPKGSEHDTNRLMLRAPLLDDRTAEPYVEKLVDMGNVSPDKKPGVYRAVRAAVSTLPTTMWPLDALPQRQLALSKLDELSFHAPSQERGGSSLQFRTESRERTRIAKLIK